MGIEIASRCGGETYLLAGKPTFMRVSRITPDSRFKLYFTYNIFLEEPGCVIGGGGWTGWTGCSLFWGNCLRGAPV